MGGGYTQNHQSAFEAGVLYCSSPSDTSLIQPWIEPSTQGIITDEFEISARRDAISGPLCFTPTMEGTSMMRDSRGSTSFRSDSEFEQSKRSFPSRRSFMSKPIHPLDTSATQVAGLLEYESSTLRRDTTHRLSSGSSSIDLADISDIFESSHLLSKSCDSSEGHKCGICDRLLSRRSPWSSKRIVKTGDMPVTGVLFCRHVFHADCLEQTTPKSHKNDPPCPVCTKVLGENSSEQCVFPRIRNSFPRQRTFSEERPSRSWGCVQVGDCVEGALHAPPRSSMLCLKRDKIKRNLCFPDKLTKNGTHPRNIFGGRFVDHVPGSCSTASAASSSRK